MVLAGAALALALATAAPASEGPEAAAACAACHGADGRPISADAPIINGQEYYYIYTQLKDFKAGRRANPVMSGIVEKFTKDDMKALAQHFAAQPWPRIGYRSDDALAGKARSALGAGQCVQCHLGGFEGSGAVPRLAGQDPAYLKRTMLELKNKIRQNAPDKSSLFRTYDESDIEAMAEYLGGL